MSHQRGPPGTRRVRSRRLAGACEIAIAGERPQRKVFRVAVVLEEEHARETRRIEPRIVPVAVGQLAAEQIQDAAPYLRGVDLATVHEAEERPSRLAGGAGARARDRAGIPVAR